MPDQGVHGRIGEHVRGHAHQQSGGQVTVCCGGRPFGLEPEQPVGVLSIGPVQPVGQAFEGAGRFGEAVEQGVVKDRAKEHALHPVIKAWAEPRLLEPVRRLHGDLEMNEILGHGASVGCPCFGHRTR